MDVWKVDSVIESGVMAAARKVSELVLEPALELVETLKETVSARRHHDHHRLCRLVPTDRTKSQTGSRRQSTRILKPG